MMSRPVLTATTTPHVLHYLASKEVRCCNGIYYYRQHTGSVSHQITSRRFDYLTAADAMKRKLIQLNAPEEILDIYENHRWLIIVDVYQFWFNHHRDLSDKRIG